MDIDALARMCKISNSDTVSRAKQYTRVYKHRCPGFGLQDVCIPPACLLLACEQTGIEGKAKELQRRSGGKEKIFNECLRNIRRELKLFPKIGVRELALQCGCIRIEKEVNRVLATYKSRFLDRLKEHERLSADFTRPAFMAVAFMLVAKKMKVKVDAAAISEKLALDSADVASIRTSMNDLCFDLIGETKKKRKASEIKSNRGLLEKTNHDDSDASDGAEDEEEEYKSWKTVVLRERQAASKGEPSKKRATQTTLSFAPQK